jgi:xanthine dehydrogenase accessory factor
VVISDARAKLATRERFPDADRIIQGWPDETLEQVDILPNTYVAILSHDPKFDEPALVGTLATPAAYIGAIGSRSTNEDRRRRLAEAGMSSEQIARMRAPIGLDIGAATPEEMAISILGEIIALRRGRSGGSLTQATGASAGKGTPRLGTRTPRLGTGTPRSVTVPSPVVPPGALSRRRDRRRRPRRRTVRPAWAVETTLAAGR